MKYAYFPGCSLEATSVAYDKSLRAVFQALGLGLHEIDDWNCCGATAYMSVRETVSFAISARNLALAEKTGHDIVAPCSACFLVLAKTRRFLQEQAVKRRSTRRWRRPISSASAGPRCAIRSTCSSMTSGSMPIGEKANGALEGLKVAPLLRLPAGRVPGATSTTASSR